MFHRTHSWKDWKILLTWVGIEPTILAIVQSTTQMTWFFNMTTCFYFNVAGQKYSYANLFLYLFGIHMHMLFKNRSPAEQVTTFSWHCSCMTAAGMFLFSLKGQRNVTHLMGFYKELRFLPATSWEYQVSPTKYQVKRCRWFGPAPMLDWIF